MRWIDTSMWIAIALSFVVGCSETGSSPVGENGIRALSAEGTSSRPPQLLPGERLGSQLPLGSACSGDDGWQPAAPEPESIGTGGVGSAPVAVPAPRGVRERWQLPPGIGFCLPPGGIYPHGYFTMNCGHDEDCPSPGVCDGTLCRLPCRADTECNPPAACVVTGVPFCQLPPQAPSLTHGGNSSKKGAIVGGATQRERGDCDCIDWLWRTVTAGDGQ